MTAADKQGLAHIRNHYQVPAHPGVRVTADRQPGHIVGADNARLLVLIDGEPEPSVWHPTWRMTYHA